MITDEQDQCVEHLQSKALKCIYGPKIPYPTMRDMAQVTMLKQRWIEACDKFAEKCLASKWCSKWFPLQSSGHVDIRATTSEKYEEEYARCDRLKNTPIFYFRR